ncbi:MAG: HEPN domain-containing protein [Eubacterium sp.]|nr:HEPN domain-containing protein [Eubacterium sp.]
MSRLLSRAKVKLENAENSYKKMDIDDAYVDECCYNLQQAIEMGLKAVVELNGLDIAENHDLRANLNVLNKNGIKLEMEKDIRSMASTLYSWETEARYKDSFTAVVDDIEDARKIAKNMISYASSLIEEMKEMVIDEIPSKQL